MNGHKNGKSGLQPKEIIPEDFFLLD